MEKEPDMKEKKQIPVPQEGLMNPMGMYPFDPLGSYTGRPMFPDEDPVQDADDL